MQVTSISKKSKTFTKNEPVKSTDYKIRLSDGSISQNTDEIIVKSMFYMKNKKTANFDKLLLTVGLLKELQLLNDSKHWKNNYIICVSKKNTFLVIYNTCLIFYIFLFARYPYLLFSNTPGNSLIYGNKLPNSQHPPSHINIKSSFGYPSVQQYTRKTTLISTIFNRKKPSPFF